MLSRLLLTLRDRCVLWGLGLVLLFPLVPGLWRLLEPSGYPLLGVFFEGWDAGAQQPMARALLRSFCAGVALCGLFLPPRAGQAGVWRSPPWTVWGTVFLGLGALSALHAPHRFQALREWEMWLLCGLLAYTVAAHWQDRLAGLILGSSYLLVTLALLYSVVLTIPHAPERPGGFFHHSNAFSTFCLMLLAVLAPRAVASGSDRPSRGFGSERSLAQLACGSLIGLLLCSGSQTGAAILAGILVYLASSRLARATRIALGLSGAGAVFVCNLLGGWWAFLGLPGLLLGGWAAGGRRTARSTALIALTAAAILALNALLAPPQALGVGNVSRESSGLGRLEFYRATLDMVARHPLLGVGPAGFAREYPAQQSSVAYFSRFPHCLPLEIASEWGIPALLALVALLWGAAKAWRRLGEPDPARSAAGWVLLVFLLHSLTDVQPQFPYLLALAAVALGVLAARSEPELVGRSGAEMPTRLLLALASLLLLTGNLLRAGGAFDRTLATRLAQRAPNSQQMVSGLLERGFMADPLDSEAARLWALSLLELQPQAARDVAALALQLDPRRGACLLVSFRADPPSAEQAPSVYAAAAQRDRINYPSFYRLWAEALRAQGRREQALEVLKSQSPLYSPTLLAALPAFRSGDLSDQLVEFYLLKALLEDEVDAGDNAEVDLRLALLHCQSSPARVTRLRRYAEHLSGPLAAKLQVLLDELEVSQNPGAVVTPLR